MKFLPLFLLTLLCMLAGCQKVEICNEKNSLRYDVARQLKVATQSRLHCVQENIEEHLQEGISRSDAISIALQYNPHIKADLETLGIAKADVQQAGLFTNPTVQTVFYAPLRGDTFGNQTQCNINLADFWLVPLRKKVQQKEFERVSLRIVATMLDVTQKVSLAYARALFYQEMVMLRKELTNQFDALRNSIEYRRAFGLEDELDHTQTIIALTQSRNSSIQAEAHLSQAYAQLRVALGITPTIKPMPLTQKLATSITHDIQSAEKLIEHAHANRPAMLEALLKEQQYQAKLSLEKASIFKEFNAGIGFQQEFDRNRGVGPSLSFQLPLFDTNQTKTDRARFLLCQAQLQTKHTSLVIANEIQQLHIMFKALLKQMHNYQTDIVPAASKGLTFAHQYQQIQQITTPVLLKTYIEWFGHKIALVTLHYEAYQTIINLERATAKRILS